MEHRPIIESGVYLKVERDDNFLFRKTRSITIRAKILEVSEVVEIHIQHRGVRIRATRAEIKAHKRVYTFKGEVKYHYPVEKWFVIEGDLHWVSKLPEAFHVVAPARMADVVPLF